MKIIFLDIDGVLNYDRCPYFFDFDTMTRHKATEENKEWGGVYGIDPEKVELLLKITEVTKAKIVLSSTWRKKDNWLEVMVANGIPKDLFVGRTVGRCGFRGHEIQEWLDENYVYKYAIIDDDSDMLPKQLPNFFQTNTKIGLTEFHVEKIINHLLETL